MRSHVVRLLTAALLGLPIAAPAAAQPPAAARKAQLPASPVADSAQTFYFSFRTALSSAMGMTDLERWMTKSGYASAMSVPAEQQPKMFAALKQMNASIVNVEVLDRVANRDTVVLRLAGYDRQTNAIMSGAAVVVREAGRWKLGRESWQDRR